MKVWLPFNSKSEVRNPKFSLVLMMIGFAIASALALAPVAASAGQSHAVRQRAKKGSICGNPQLECKTVVPFKPNDLPFRVPEASVIFDTELFYAVIIKSVTAREDDCDLFVPESERLAAQALFPDRKVFSSRCVDIENLFYTNVDSKARFMAVYAGTTLAEARKVLQLVRATGKYPDAMMRRMRTGFNGT